MDYAALRNATSSKLIKMPQLMLLIMANKHMHGWNVTDLAAVTGAKPSVITMAKNKLRRENLLTEHVPQRDRRRTKVYLTAPGRVEAHALWNVLRAVAATEKCLRDRLP